MRRDFTGKPLMKSFQRGGDCLAVSNEERGNSTGCPCWLNGAFVSLVVVTIQHPLIHLSVVFENLSVIWSSSVCIRRKTSRWRKSQAHRDFPPLALTFFHRALAAADIFARAAALIFRLRLGLFGIGPVFAKD